MAEVDETLVSTFDAFGAARGEDLDEVWAFAVSWKLLMNDVEVDQVRDALEEALSIVRETRESPEALFGPARDHADALYDEWLSEGGLVLAAHVMTWRQAVTTGLVTSAACATVFTVILFLRDEATAALLARFSAISLVIGMGSSLGRAAWQRRHRPRRLAVDAPSDLRWSVGLTEILRTRYSMSGSRVGVIVAEADSHAAEAGRSVQEEFGTPEEYAARFAPDLARRSLLTAAFLGLLALLDVVLLLDGPHWSNVGLLVVIGWMAAAEHRKVRALRAR
jgi:hypothetical protein